MAPTTVEGKIARAVTNRVTTLGLDLPIAWQNVTFKPETDAPDGKWLRVQHVPNTVERMQIASDGAHRFLGLLQVTVHWPKGDGEIEPREIAGQIVAHFPCDLTLTEDDVSVRITQRPRAGDMLIESAGAMVPVMISYECYH